MEDEGSPGDADDGFDEGLPVGAGQRVADGKDADGAILLTIARMIACECGIVRLVASGDGAGGFKQGSLVALDLGDEMIARRQRRREGFFGHAWHPL